MAVPRAPRKMADVTPGPAYAVLKSSEHFDYDEMKKRYMEQVNMYYCNRKLQVLTPYTREVVNRIIKLIKEREVLMAAGHPSEHPKYKVTKKYEVIVQNDKDILISKRLVPEDPVVEIVPAEDCFDILIEAHLQTKHGGKEKMLNAIKHAKVPKTSIDFLLVVCKVCNLNGRTKRRADEKIPQIFHSRGQVSIIDMTEEPDNQFKHILCYIDRFTRYLLLRPLMTDSVQETAMELLKIFFDFGPPQKLETYNRPFFLQVMSLINTAHSEFNIRLLLPNKMPVLTPCHVKLMLRKWQNDSGCNNWAMGCYKVQWNNNSSVDSMQSSPYSCVFKRGPVIVFTDKEDESQKKAKTTEDDVNSHSTTVYSHCLNSTEDKNGSNTSVVLDCVNDDNEVLLASEEIELSEDDDDCLITFTEVPSDPVLATVALPKQYKGKKVLTIDPAGKVTDGNISTVKNPILTKASSISVNTDNNNTVKELNQIESKDVQTPPNKRCHVCKTEIKKAYTCTKCQRNVHLFCSDRLLKPNIPVEILTVTCTSCKLTKIGMGNDELKRKSSALKK